MHRAWNYEKTLQRLAWRVQLSPQEVESWRGEEGEGEEREEKGEVVRVEKRH